MHPKLQEHLFQQCNRRCLTVSAAQIAQLMHYLELVLTWRQRLNLTGLQDAERILEVLIIESLDFLGHDLLPPTARVLDLGTGAGVPGIPLAICAPACHFTLLDRTQKKMTFVQRVVSLLGLENCQLCCDTSESLARRLTPAQRFDVVVSRGVGQVAHLLRLAAGLVQPGGQLLLRKPTTSTEVQAAVTHLSAGNWGDIRQFPVTSSDPSGWALLAIRKA